MISWVLYLKLVITKACNLMIGSGIMTFKIQKFATLCAIMIFTTCFTLEAQAMSLRQAVQKAIDNNPRISQSRASHRKSLASVRAARSGFLPSITLSANAGLQNIDRPNGLSSSNNNKNRFARSVNVGVKQLLFDGFSTNNKIRSQEAQTDAASLNIFVESEALGLDTVEAYIDVLRYQQVYAIAVQNERRHRQILDLIQKQFNAGNSGLADKEQAQERVYSAAATVSDVKRSIGDIKAKFRNLVGVAPNNLSQPSSLRFKFRSPDSALDEIAKNNPQIQAAIADADAARYDYKAAQGNKLPTFTIEGGATFAEDVDGVKGRNNDYAVKGVLTWELYSGGRISAQAAAAGENWTERLLRVDRLRREARESYERAWSAYSSLGERIANLKKAENAGQRIVSAYIKEYEVGQRSLIDILDAENNLFNARINLANAQAVYIFSGYQIEAALGNLLKRLDVTHPQSGISFQRDNSSFLPKSFGVSFEPLRK